MSRDFIIYPALIGMLAISIPLFRSDESKFETTAAVKTEVKALEVAEVKHQVPETVNKTETNETLTEQVQVQPEQPVEKEIMLTSIPAKRSTEPVAELIQQEPVAKSRKSTLFGRLCAAVKSQNEDLELPPVPTPTDAGEHGDHDHGDHSHDDHDHADHSHDDHHHHADHDDHGHADHSHDDHDHHDHADHHHHDHADHSHSHGEQIYGESVVAPMELAPMAPVQLESAPMESYGVEIASDVSYAPTYSAPEIFCEPVQQPVYQPITIAPVVAPIVMQTPIIIQQFVPAPVTYFYQPVYRKKACCGLLSGLHTHFRNLFARHIAKKRARWGFGRRSGCCY